MKKVLFCGLLLLGARFAHAQADYHDCSNAYENASNVAFSLELTYPLEGGELGNADKVMQLRRIEQDLDSISNWIRIKPEDPELMGLCSGVSLARLKLLSAGFADLMVERRNAEWKRRVASAVPAVDLGLAWLGRQR